MKSKKRKTRKLQGAVGFEILKYLAKNGQGYMYPLHESTYESYIASRTTVHRAKKELIKHNLIKPFREKVVDGRTRKIYTLTTEGFLLVLNAIPRFKSNEIDEIAQNNNQRLPLIFGKWDFFIKMGLRNEIINRIYKAIYWFIRLRGNSWYRTVANNGSTQEMIEAVERMKGKEEVEMFVESNKLLMGDLTASVFGLSLEIPFDARLLGESENEQKSFLKKLAEDSDLKEYMSTKIRVFNEIRKTEYENSNYWKEWFDDIT